MKTNKILIIKRVSNDFDEFVVQNLDTAADYIDAKDVFKGKGKIIRKIVKTIKEFHLMLLLPLFLNVKPRDIQDYSQIILFDDYPDDTLIEWIKKKNPRVKIKLWLWNVPEYSIDRLKKFCSVYCFDQEYAKQNNIQFIEQFYFDEYIKEVTIKEPEQQVCYIGYDKNRRELLDKMADIFERDSITYLFRLISNSEPEQINRQYQIKKDHVDYKDVIEIDCKSKAIIEIVSSFQKGLTWRALEALFLNKKLITNNLEIKKFDFYKKENIFVIGVDDIDKLPLFLSLPLVKVDSEIKEKYRFKSWLNKITR